MFVNLVDLCISFSRQRVYKSGKKCLRRSICGGGGDKEKREEDIAKECGDNLIIENGVECVFRILAVPFLNVYVDKESLNCNNYLIEQITKMNFPGCCCCTRNFASVVGVDHLMCISGWFIVIIIY